MTDRDKVIKGLQIERECVSRDCNRNCGQCDLVQDRDWLLSVYDDALALLKEQEAKAGKWIPIESPTGVEAFGVKEMTVMNVYCSVCGSEEDVSFTEYKYCPRCGARMEGW